MQLKLCYSLTVRSMNFWNENQINWKFIIPFPSLFFSSFFKGKYKCGDVIWKNLHGRTKSPWRKETGQKKKKGKYRTLHCHLSKTTLYAAEGFLKMIILRVAKPSFCFILPVIFKTWSLIAMTICGIQSPLILLQVYVCTNDLRKVTVAQVRKTGFSIIFRCLKMCPD